MKKTVLFLVIILTSCSTTRLAPVTERRGLMLLEPHELTGNKKFTKKYIKTKRKHKNTKHKINYTWNDTNLT
jgi:hypothetical protein